MYAPQVDWRLIRFLSPTSPRIMMLQRALARMRRNIYVETTTIPPSQGKSLALLPAGGEVWEDFLDTIGVSLEQFCSEGPGGWMLGYLDALGRINVRTVIIL